MVVEPWRRDVDDVAAELETDPPPLTSPKPWLAYTASGRTSSTRRRPVPRWRKFLASSPTRWSTSCSPRSIVSLVAWVIEGRRGGAVRGHRDRRDHPANAVLGYVQEARAEQAVAALQRMAAATTGRS